MPIKVRGSVLGYLRANKPPASGMWSDDETEMLRTLTEQLGAALDSARLFEETLTRAERERTIGLIASRVRETLDIETVLKTATLEMQKALDLEEVEVRMNQNIIQDQRK
jgi:GAF domain-containing protein